MNLFRKRITCALMRDMISAVCTSNTLAASRNNRDYLSADWTDQGDEEASLMGQERACSTSSSRQQDWVLPLSTTKGIRQANNVNGIARRRIGNDRLVCLWTNDDTCTVRRRIRRAITHTLRSSIRSIVQVIQRDGHQRYDTQTPQRQGVDEPICYASSISDSE